MRKWACDIRLDIMQDMAVQKEELIKTVRRKRFMAFFDEEVNKLSLRKILDSVWGYDYIGGYRSVDTLVKKLRAKLTKKYPYIQTVYGVGYCFDV